MRSLNRILAGLILSISGLSSASGSSASTAIEFDVFLDEKKIGWHRFDFQHAENDALKVQSVARFDVKFLFVTAFRYRHRAAEIWDDGCLREIEADTNSNGKKTQVRGVAEDAVFLLDTQSAADEERLNGCVMTFAYWNPEFLAQEQLLNPQTGDYVDVVVQEQGVSQIDLDGRKLSATEYQITGEGINVNVWYGEDNRWLALESPAKGNRVLRYERALEELL